MEEYEDLLKINKKWAIWFGCWSNGKRNALQIMQLLLIFAIEFLNMITNTINFLRCKGDLNCMMDTVTHLSVIIGSVYFLTVFLLKEHVFRTALDRLYAMRETYGAHKYTAKTEKFNRISVFAINAYCNVGLVMYVLIPVLSYNYCVEHTNRFSKRLDMFTCGLAMPAWFPFDTTTSPGYESALVFQSVAATLAIHCVGQPQNIYWCLLTHVMAHVRLLKDNLKKIRGNPTQEKRFRVLQRCVEHHIAIINCVTPVLDACSKILFFNMIFIVLILTATGFQTIKIVMTVDYWNFGKYTIMLTGWSVVFFINSYVGQKLIDSSWEVMDYAYNTEWYDEPVPFQKMILLIMMRANRPLVMKSASLSVNSFANFNQVMSNVYSYITLLLNYLD